MKKESNETLEFERIESKARKCHKCAHYGNVVYNRKRKSRMDGKMELLDYHECSIHPGCINTRYSLACDDYESSDIINKQHGVRY